MHVRAHWRIIPIVAIALVLDMAGIGITHPVRAQTMQVTIKNFSFQPATLTVPAGTTVTWTNQDSVDHTSTSDTGVWDSGRLAPGQSFSFMFTQAGMFPYHCMIHPFMKGMIVVQASAVASPTISATVTSSAVTPTSTATSIPLAAYPVRMPQMMMRLRMGPRSLLRHVDWLGYYDGHEDSYLNTDVSNQAQARAMHINYAPALKRMSMGAVPAIYLVKGRAVGNQLAVFGSEPGEKSYSPIWHEVIVQWKPHVKPVLLRSDNQILALAKKGKLVMHHNNTMLNCPIIKVHA